MKKIINLGDEASVKLAFSYPNIPAKETSLEDTVLHWCEQMLDRDGLKAKGALAKVSISEQQCNLELEGNKSLDVDFAIYAERLPKLLSIGLKAHKNVFPVLEKEGKWDPENTGKWRFFLPLGLPMVKQKSLQFFHYPPIRLLDPMQDYLEDPVPVRWEELLMANGLITQAQARFYETVVDATPIAAPDDQGSKTPKDKNKFKYGLIPIEYFTQYQKDLVEQRYDKMVDNIEKDHYYLAVFQFCVLSWKADRLQYAPQPSNQAYFSRNTRPSHPTKPCSREIRAPAMGSSLFIEK